MVVVVNNDCYFFLTMTAGLLAKVFHEGAILGATTVLTPFGTQRVFVLTFVILTFVQGVNLVNVMPDARECPFNYIKYQCETLMVFF